MSDRQGGFELGLGRGIDQVSDIGGTIERRPAIDQRLVASSRCHPLPIWASRHGIHRPHRIGNLFPLRGVGRFEHPCWSPSIDPGL
jgi:hypothetical protein